jgi:sporulation protein YabP
MNQETPLPHSVCIRNRQLAELDGIREVVNFDETGILLLSSDGELSIEGEGLRIDRFSVESGHVTVVGKISALYYTERKTNGRRSIFSRRSE